MGPLFLAIDEFGKNLEAFADAPAEGDLFLLQQLAEWSHGGKRPPACRGHFQHLAFDEYVSSASDVQRREWAKVQGRFEDIPYVDTPAQTRVLIANAWKESGHAPFNQALQKWAEAELKNCRRAGLAELFDGTEQVAGCWPLHPVAQLVLPELCARYGQNERTLFSFLASREPLSLASFLSEQTWSRGRPLPVAGVDRLYDYFVDSAEHDNWSGAIGQSLDRGRIADPRRGRALRVRAPTAQDYWAPQFGFRRRRSPRVTSCDPLRDD
jgi:hypothetical protein